MIPTTNDLIEKFIYSQTNLDNIEIYEYYSSRQGNIVITFIVDGIKKTEEYNILDYITFIFNSKT